ncbi:putative Arylsulfatase [Seiridium unicorne]|uniref:Arylsulfatase n=1 Tax=Seiridium unicorne TaxID=138068 RepID=A0ABR2UZV6_9PEZI
MIVVAQLLLVAAAVAKLAAATAAAATNHDPDPCPPTSPKPNFIFIMTDDQDLHLSSMDYMPAVDRHFTKEGTTFDKHYATVSLCCPSRVTLLTGRAAHNTNVTDIKPPFGGYPQFIAEGWNDNYLPVWLQAEGYNTYMAGKLMNGFSETNCNDPPPNGWTSRDLFIDPNTYTYYNASMQKDQGEVKFYPGEYSTDMVANKSIDFLDDAIHAGQPFFLAVTPIGPHSELVDDGFTHPLPAQRHEHMYPGLKAPRTSNFNPDVPSSGGWIKTLDPLNDTVIDYMDDWYRNRILALQSVDDLVDNILERLHKDPDVLDNTYLIYTSDNGYHIGQHRLAPGKTCAIEEDINIPFVIRGPGIEKGKRVSIPTTHTDIVPTLFQLAGIPLQDEFDGQPMPVTSDQLNELDNCSHKTEHIGVEYWGIGLLEGKYQGNGTLIDNGGGLFNTYKALRVIADDYNIAYVVWCLNEHELYDMEADPGQMNNLYDTNGTINNWPVPKLTARIDALLLTLKACKGRVCTHPWETLHPQDDVHSLREAMNPKFDDFYTNELKVTYTACMKGYIPEFEGALYPIPYGESGNWSTGARWRGNGNDLLDAR